MSTFQSPNGQITPPHQVNAGSLITVNPGAGATVTLEYTLGSRADIRNRVATWQTWPKGTVTASTQDLVAETIQVRSTSIGGADSNVFVEPFPSPQQLQAYKTAIGVPLSLGGGTLAGLTGTYAIGQTLTATYPAGTVGTIQFTRTQLVPPYAKTPINGAVANAVGSLTYTVQQADVGFNIGADSSNQVSSSAGGLIPAPAVPVIITPTTVSIASTYTNSEATSAQQWTLDGVDVAGATAVTYSQSLVDATKVLRVRTTAALGPSTSLGALPGVRNLKYSNTPVLRSILASNDGLLLICGDSYLAGFGSGGVSGNGEAGKRINSAMSLLAGLLNGIGKQSSIDSWFGIGNYANNTAALVQAEDPRWTALPAHLILPNQTPNTVFGGGMMAFNTTYPAEVMTWTPANSFDTVDIYTTVNPTQGDILVSVDGGTTTLATIPGVSANLGILKTTVSVPAGSAAVTLKYAAGSATGQTGVTGIETRNSAAPKIRFVNGALTGTTVQINAKAVGTTAANNAYGPRAGMAKIANGVTKGILVLDGWFNDQTLGRTLAQILADYDALCIEAKARGWEVWYIGYAAIAANTTLFNSFEDSISNYLVTNYNAVVIQASKMLTLSAYGSNFSTYYFDSLHLNPTGQTKLAQLFFSASKLVIANEVPA